MRPILTDWMSEVLFKHDLSGLIQEHGSPVNLLRVEPMRKNIARLQKVAQDRKIHFQIHFALKANKCVEFVAAANQAGIGIDVASEAEWVQAIQSGTHSRKIICTAAIKNQSLVDQCIANGATLVIDNDDEWALIEARAGTLAKPAHVAIRLSGFQHDQTKLISRFGFDIDQTHCWMSPPRDGALQVIGLQFHLDGPDLNQRVSALRQTLDLADQLRSLGHGIEFIDIGGGIPVKTHQDDDSLVGANWLASLLDATIEGTGLTQHLQDRKLSLRCEPGRSLLDRCGMTIARVEFRKQTVAGDWLVGVAMNHTQCHPTHDGQLADPILLRKPDSADDSSDPITGCFVGGQCTEHDFISQRRFHFDHGVQRGDLVAFTNTAAYQMHFSETGSHGSPLAKNLFDI